MKNYLLPTYNVFWKIVISSIIVILIAVVEVHPTKAETPIQNATSDTNVQKTNGITKSGSSVSTPKMICIKLTDVFQLNMCSITEEDSNGKTKTRFVSVEDKTGTIGGIVCIGTYNNKKIITVISPLQVDEVKTKHTLNGIGTIYKIPSIDMVNAVKAELKKEKMPEEIANDLDTNNYIVIDYKALWNETEKRVNYDTGKVETTKSSTLHGSSVVKVISGITALVGLIAWRKKKKRGEKENG
jgi:hypothetical protein